MKKKGLLLVLVLVVVLVAGFFGATIHRNHELGAQLVTDLAALRGKRITLLRPEGTPPPQHSNGLACFQSVLKTGPASLSSLSDPKNELGAFARGERPLTELSDATRSSLEPLRPFVAALRGCSDAAELQWVEGVEPWSDNTYPLKSNAVLLHTALDLRIQLAEGHAALALRQCTETLEVYLELSHLGLLGAMVTTNAVKRLAPLCATSWSQVTDDVRKEIGPRWVLLSTRMVSDAEIIETERVTMNLLLFSPLASDESRAQYPAVSSKGLEVSRIERLTLMRLWSRYDAQMRQLIAAKDEAAFLAADAEMAKGVWWLPEGSLLNSGGFGGYVKVRRRLDGTRAVLGALTSIATGAPLPATATEKDGVITLPATVADEAPLQLTR